MTQADSKPIPIQGTESSTYIGSMRGLTDYGSIPQTCALPSTPGPLFLTDDNEGIQGLELLK